VNTARSQATLVGVPFLDLGPSHEGLKAELLAALSDLIDANAYTNGPEIARFEQQFAAFCGADLCIGVASGLDALQLGLLAAGVKPGDDVIVPANTFFATFEAVSHIGARPVPVDVSEQDYNLDAAHLEATLTDSTRAVVPVHLYGQLADMRRVREIAGRHGLIVVEDACQAHGAMRDGIRAGTAGLAGAFSFYPGKNLGAFGDAGALVTSDPVLAENMRMLREHGQRQKYRHEQIGYTSRLDTVQALVLLCKLPHLDAWNAQRRELAARYEAGLANIGDIRLPPVPAGSEPVWHLYVLRTARRDELAAHLRSQGIGVGLHYPQPPHLSPAYAELGFGAGAFPLTEALSRELLSLPLFPGMTDEQLDTVVAAVTRFFAGG
jgi:dTDP-4-amino-4,6-dideoxygalactose transaminase